jgi:hypothetical protein
VEPRHGHAERLGRQRIELEVKRFGRKSKRRCSCDGGELAIELLKRRLMGGRRSSVGLKQCVAAPSELLGCIEQLARLLRVLLCDSLDEREERSLLGAVAWASCGRGCGC